MTRIDRRTMLGGCAAGAISAWLPSAASGHAPPAEILDTKVISWQPHLYKGWPTVARRQSGALLLVWSGGREAHVCPFGQVKLMRSYDEGQSWTWPNVILDGPIDDRDAGVLETRAGTILVTSFSSLAYEPALLRAAKLKPGDQGAWAADRLQRWMAAHQRVDAAGRKAALGVWMTRSTDGGLTWSPRYDCVVDSPHGPIQLEDGRLLYAGKALWAAEPRVGVAESTDDGVTWTWLAELPLRRVTAMRTTMNCTRSMRGRDAWCCRSATTTRRTKGKLCRRSLPMAGAVGARRMRLACGVCPRICCGCPMAAW